jgi:hypothetical protein
MNSAGIVFLDECRRVRTRPRWNKLGVAGSLFSVLGIFTLGIASPIGLGLSLLGMLRRPRGSALFGTILGGLGTAFLLVWGGSLVAGIQALDNQAKAERTSAALQTAVAEIEDFRLENHQLPEGIKGNMLLIEAELVDAWGEDLRYDAIDKQQYTVRSAGPDKEFDTSDDLTRS